MTESAVDGEEARRLSTKRASDGTHRSPARAIADRRHAKERLLRVATRLASESAAPTRHFAVAHVSVADVAHAAGVTRSAIYRLWPSRQDFWSDVLDYVLATGPRAGDDHPVAEVHCAPDNASAPLAATLDATQDVLMADPLPLLRAGVVAYPGRAATTATGNQARTAATLQHQIATRLHAARARCIPGVSALDLAVALTAIGQGLPVTARMTPQQELVVAPADASIDLPTRPRTLFGASMQALLDELTEPGVDTTSRADPPGIDHRSPAATTDRRWTGARGRYLRIAASLVLSPGPRDDRSRVLGHVTLDTLARAAQVSRRTLTNVWSDQAEFRLDLFLHLLDIERRRVVEAIRDAADGAAASPDHATAFLAVGDLMHDDLMRHLDTASFLAFAPHLDEPDLCQAALRAQWQHTTDAGLHLRRLLASVRRRVRDGVSLRQLASALFMLADGANRLARTDASLLCRTAPGSRGAHGTTAYAAAAILNQLTQPIESGTAATRLATWLS